MFHKSDNSIAADLVQYWYFYFSSPLVVYIYLYNYFLLAMHVLRTGTSTSTVHVIFDFVWCISFGPQALFVVSHFSD